ncbi:MAG: hypothetical protein DRH03_00010 [Deltaproteobacteria bacterium]|nr:MAG: hypothetical protein DRH03_00010 [Deltaproteobacteria bacterium]
MFTIRHWQCIDSGQLTGAVKGATFHRTQTSKGVFCGSLLRAEIGRGVLDTGFYNRDLMTEGQFPKDTVTVAMFLDAKVETIFNGISLEPNDLSVIKPGTETLYTIPAETRWASLQIKSEDLRLLGVDFANSKNKIFKKRSLSHYPFMTILHSLVNRLQYSEDRHLTSFAPDIMYNHLVENLAYLLTREQEQITLTHDRYQQIAATVKRILNDDITNIIQVSDLCHLTGQSERTLERVCKKAFGLPPQRLLKSHRLKVVRKALQSNTEEKLNISKLSMDYGFMHPSRFAGEYKNHFGELPSQTLTRNR